MQALCLKLCFASVSLACGAVLQVLSRAAELSARQPSEDVRVAQSTKRGSTCKTGQRGTLAGFCRISIVSRCWMMDLSDATNTKHPTGLLGRCWCSTFWILVTSPRPSSCLARRARAPHAQSFCCSRWGISRGGCESWAQSC